MENTKEKVMEGTGRHGERRECEKRQETPWQFESYLSVKIRNLK